MLKSFVAASEPYSVAAYFLGIHWWPETWVTQIYSFHGFGVSQTTCSVTEATILMIVNAVIPLCGVF
jgi:hypothetical protein